MSLHFILLLTIKLLSKFVLCCGSVLEAVQNEFFLPFLLFHFRRSMRTKHNMSFVLSVEWMSFWLFVFNLRFSLVRNNSSAWEIVCYLKLHSNSFQNIMAQSSNNNLISLKISEGHKFGSS